MEQKIRFVFTNEGDSEFPAFGAFRQFSMKDGKPHIFFNMDSLCYYANEDKEGRLDYLKDSLLQTITHEFCHAFQEYLNMELDEETVDKILEAYNPLWIARSKEDVNPNEEEPMVSADSTIEMLEHLLTLNSLEDVKGKINEIMPSLKSWAYRG